MSLVAGAEKQTVDTGPKTSGLISLAISILTRRPENRLSKERLMRVAGSFFIRYTHEKYYGYRSPYANCLTALTAYTATTHTSPLPLALGATRSNPGRESRFRAEAGVGAQDGRGAWRGDEGGVGEGEHPPHLRRTPVVLHVVLGVPDRSFERRVLKRWRQWQRAGRAAPCAEHVGGGPRRVGDERRRARGRGESSLLGTTLEREEAIKEALTTWRTLQTQVVKGAPWGTTGPCFKR
ncbi:hypothetical protein B0H13DRAFT_1934922 [Mycena leptocephala]|nr:hypothetical protein B0H13DRAFT_1934922 [Mycena leptocephala]